MEDSHLAWLLVLDKNDSRHLERIMAAGEGIWRLAKDSVPELRAQLNSYLREITEACHAIESGTESAREKKRSYLKRSPRTANACNRATQSQPKSLILHVRLVISS
jgi:hypothetical protein